MCQILKILELKLRLYLNLYYQNISWIYKKLPLNTPFCGPTPPPPPPPKKKKKKKKMQIWTNLVAHGFRSKKVWNTPIGGRFSCMYRKVPWFMQGFFYMLIKIIITQKHSRQFSVSLFTYWAIENSCSMTFYALFRPK